MSTTTDQSEHVSIAEAGRILGVSVATVYRRINAGHLQAFDISDPNSPQRTIRLRRSDVEGLLRPLDIANSSVEGGGAS